jgi:hypothetical protein
MMVMMMSCMRVLWRGGSGERSNGGKIAFRRGIKARLAPG